MVDHLAMRKAFLAAIDQKYMGWCNSCKTPYEKNTGQVEDVHLSDVIYNIWFCNSCFNQEPLCVYPQ